MKPILFFLLLLYTNAILGQRDTVPSEQLHFRVFKPSGQLLTPEDMTYKLFFSTYMVNMDSIGWSNHKTKPLTDKFRFRNGYYEYRFDFPEFPGTGSDTGLTVYILHEKDTMKISPGPTDMYFDSVTFRPGRYSFDPETEMLYDIKSKNNLIVRNLFHNELVRIEKHPKHQITFLYQAMLPPIKNIATRSFSGVPTKFERLPDSSYVAYLPCGSINSTWIWESRDGIVWDTPYESPYTWQIQRMIDKLPSHFNISDLPFEPHVSNVTAVSWSKDPLLTFYIATKMHFINSEIGYMLANSFASLPRLNEIYKTTDGGKNWNLIKPYQGNDLFYCANNVYAYPSSNNRMNYFVKILPDDSLVEIPSLTTGVFSPDFNNIGFQNDSMLFFLATSYENKGKYGLYKSVDGGKTRNLVIEELCYTCSLIVGKDYVLLWFGKDYFWKSNDQGKTWSYYHETEKITMDPNYYSHITDTTNFAYKPFIGQDGTLMSTYCWRNGATFLGQLLIDREPTQTERGESDKKLSGYRKTEGKK